MEAMMEPRHVMADEKMIPANGDHGGSSTGFDLPFLYKGF